MPRYCDSGEHQWPQLCYIRAGMRSVKFVLRGISSTAVDSDIHFEVVHNSCTSFCPGIHAIFALAHQNAFYSPSSCPTSESFIECGQIPGGLGLVDHSQSFMWSLTVRTVAN